MEERRVLATWNGSVSDNWGDSGNWTPNDVPDSAGETATFNGADPGEIVVNSSFTVGTLEVSGAASDYTFTGSTLNLTTANISAGADVKVAGDGNQNVLGDAAINLDNADLTYQLPPGAIVDTPGQIRGRYWDYNPGANGNEVANGFTTFQGTLDTIDNVLPDPPNFDLPLTQALNTDGTFGGFGADIGGNNNIAVWQGFISVDAADAGTVTFETQSDDGSFIYVDGQLVVDNSGFHGNRTRTGDFDLTAGQHEILISFFEGGGGQNFDAFWNGPITGSNRVNIDPTATGNSGNSFFFTRDLNAALTPDFDFSNDISATGNSSISLGSGVTSLNLGSLDLNGSVEINGEGQAVNFGDLNLSGAANTIATNGLSASVGSIPTGTDFTKGGDGTLEFRELPSPFSATQTITVEDGTLLVGMQGANTGLGDADIVLVDGTIEGFAVLGSVANPGLNVIAHYGFHVNDDATALDLNNNGGIMGGGDPTSHPDFFGLAALTDGPGGRGLDFNGDGDFTATGAIGQNDNYSNLFLSTITVTAATAGDWRFDVQQDDDRSGMWLDINGNGIFESSQAGLGSNRGEQLAWEDGGEKVVNLAPGTYLFAVTHREGGGGSGIEVDIQSPTMPQKENIKPSDPDQAGIFSATGVVGAGLIANDIDILGNGGINTGDVPGITVTGNVEFGSGAIEASLTSTVNSGTVTLTNANLHNNATFETLGSGETIVQNIDDAAGTFDLIKDGSSTLTLPTDNTFGGSLTIEQGTVLAQADGALGNDAGTTTVNGGRLMLDGGITLPASETITINGAGVGDTADGAIRNLGGDNTIEGDVIVASDAQIGLGGGNLIINGNVTLTGNLTVDTGAANRTLTINGVVSGAGSITLANDGIVRLTNGGNDFTGDVNVPTGILQVAAEGALGDPATGTTVDGDGTLQFDGAFDYTTGEPITISGGGEGGLGALSNSNGDTTLTSPVTIASANLTNQVSIGSESDTLTIESDLDLGIFGLTLTGSAGTVVLNGDISSAAVDAAYSVEFGTNRSDDPTQIYVDMNQDGTFRTADNERVVDRACCGNQFNRTMIAPGTYRYLATHREGGGGSNTEPTINLFNAGRQTVQPGAMNGLFSTSDDAAAIFGFGSTTVMADQLDAYAFIAPSRDDVYLDDIGEDNGGAALPIQGGPQSLLRIAPVSHIVIDGDDRIDYRNDGDFRNGNTGRNAQGFDVSDTSDASLPGINQNDDYATAFYGLINIPNLPGVGTITKIGDGAAVLNGDNSFAGEVTVSSGTLIAGTDTALSDPAVGTTVGAAATLGLQGGVTVDETVQLNGTLANVAGDNTYTGDLTGPTGPVFPFTIESQTAGDTFTVATDVDQQDGTLIFDGPGNTIIDGVISGNGDPLTFTDGLVAERYNTGSNQLNFSAQGGGAYTINADRSFTQSGGLLSTMPDHTGIQDFGEMNFDREGDNNPGGVAPFHWSALLPTAPTGDTNNFQVVWTGTFVPDVDGNFNFGSRDINGAGTNVDDDASIYVDANLNGIFEASEGFSSGGGQTHSASGLSAGVAYPVVFGYREGGGDEEVSYTIQGPSGLFASETTINPATQPSVWGLPGGSNNRVVMRGDGMVTLTQNNTYNGDTIIEAGTLVAADPGALGDTAATTTVRSGGSLGLAGDITLSAEDVELNGPGANGQGALVNVSGDNTFDANLTIPAVAVGVGEIGIGSLAGELTVERDVDLLNNNLTVSGAGNVTINGTVFSSDRSAMLQTFSPGLVERVYDVRNIDNPFGDPLLSDTVQSGPRAGYFTTNQGPWAIDGGNETIVYTGEFFDADGIFSFSGQIDDDMLISIDGVQVLRSTAWNVVKSTAISDGYDGGNEIGNANPDGGTVDFGMGPNGDGWHEIEFRFANGGGGEGAVGNDGWTTTFGFALSNPASGDPNDLPGVDGSAGGDGTELDGSNPAFLVADDPGDGSLFRYATIAAGMVDNTLTKEGTGNLTLTAANTYVGGTTINEGDLVANNTTGSATGPGDITITGDFATLAGTGSVAGAVAANMTTQPSMVDVGPDLGVAPIVASTLTTGDLTVTGSVLVFDITDNDATDDVVDGTLNDTLDVDGTVSLTGWLSLMIDTNVRPANNDTFVLIDNDGNDPIVGSLFDFVTNDPLTEGASFTVEVTDGGLVRNREFTISYIGGDGNDLVVTHTNRVPVPTDQTVNLNEDPADPSVESTFTFAAGDPDNDAVSVNVPLVDDVDNGTLVDNGDGTFTYTPDAHFSGTDSFTYTANDGELNSDPGSPATVTIVVAPIADEPNLEVGGGNATINGDEDAAIPLGITSSLVDTDGSETLEIVIAGVPTGATLSAGTDNGGGQWTLTPAELANLTVTPVANSDVDFTLTITATATEAQPAPTPADQAASVTETLTVTVNPVADAPNVSTVPVGGADTENIPIDLGLGGALADTDGSETISSVVITGVPADATLSAGIDNGGGMWTLTEAQLAGLTMTKLDGEHNPSTIVTLTVTFNVTDTDTEGLVPDDTGSLSSPLDVTVDNTPPTSTVAVLGGGGQTVSGFATPFEVTATDINSGVGGLDPDADGPFSYRIDWGDGSDPDNDGNAGEIISGVTSFETISHAFTNFGTLTVTVWATDGDGEEGPASTTQITVVPVAVIDGDIYAGGTNNSDTIIYYPNNAGVMVRFNTSFFGPFLVQADTELLAFGQGGNDRIVVAGDIGVPAVFDGGIGNDHLSGQSNDDTLIGGAGNDILLGGEGNNLLIGDDREGEVVAGSDRIEGRSGVDYIFGGGSNDRINGGAGNDVVHGGLGNDFIFGGLGDDFLFGGQGADTINGHYGNDVIHGAADSDQIFGSADQDLIIAGTARDRVRGDAGDDDIVGGTSGIDTEIEAALDAILTGLVGPDLTAADVLLGSDVDGALQLWFGGNSRSGFGGFVDDGVSDDLSGGTGGDEVHNSDGLRDFRAGEDSSF